MTVIAEECKATSIANHRVENRVNILAADTDKAADSDGFEPLESNDDISHDYGELPSTHSKGIEGCSSTKEENGSAIWNVGNERKVIGEECKTLSIANDGVENGVSILAADTDEAGNSDGFEPLESNDDISHMVSCQVLIAKAWKLVSQLRKRMDRLEEARSIAKEGHEDEMNLVRDYFLFLEKTMF